MEHEKMKTAGVLALAAAMLAASPAAAQASPSPAVASHDVAVAVIDLGADHLYAKDENVSFVDLTPPVKDGFRSARAMVEGCDHGSIVAQTFVQEYRRIDPHARITIYTINPFLEKGMASQMVFSRSMLRQALPKLSATTVKVAITTFGVSDQAQGSAILQDIRAAGLIVFAASPNNKDDEGIWPAADPAAIAVADGATPDSPFFKAKSWSGWIDVVANGQYHKANVDAQGSSFATPRAAAYGVHYASSHPNADTDEVRRALASGSETVTAFGKSFPKLGEHAAERYLTAQTAVGPATAIASVDPMIAAAFAARSGRSR